MVCVLTREDDGGVCAVHFYGAEEGDGACAALFGQRANGAAEVEGFRIGDESGRRHYG